jgi:hypothetical protein
MIREGTLQQINWHHYSPKFKGKNKDPLKKKIGKKKQQKKKKLIAWTTFGSLNRSICPLGTLPFVKDEKSMWTHMAMFSTSYTRDKGPVPAV